MLPDLHIGFSRGRSGGLVFPSLSEFSADYCDSHCQRLWHSLNYLNLVDFSSKSTHKRICFFLEVSTVAWMRSSFSVSLSLMAERPTTRLHLPCLSLCPRCLAQCLECRSCTVIICKKIIIIIIKEREIYEEWLSFNSFSPTFKELVHRNYFLNVHELM